MNRQTILIYGAGVLGSIYGARLQQAGHHVTMLTRGDRHAFLKKNGIILQNFFAGKEEQVHIDTIRTVEPDQLFDLILVPMRKDQIDSALPAIHQNRSKTVLLIRINTPAIMELGQWLPGRHSAFCEP